MLFDYVSPAVLLIVAIWQVDAQIQATPSPSAVNRPTPNSVWPDDAAIDKVSVAKSKQQVCSRISRQPEELTRERDYTITPLSSAVPGGAGSILQAISAYRRTEHGEPFVDVVNECGADRSEADPSANCGDAWQTYVFSILWPFMVPLLATALMFMLWCTCCFVACCRCCRQCICCAEGLEPRKIHGSEVGLALFFWTVASITQVALCSSMIEVSSSLNESVNRMLCTAHQFADETLYGDSWFLGISPALDRMTSISYALDADNTTMKTLRSVLAQSEGFAAKHDLLRRRLAHFSATIGEVGSGKRIYDHRCVFCNLALGQGNDGPEAAPPPGFPEQGVLVELQQEVLSSSSEAMDHIRRNSLDRLTGPALTDLARRVKLAKAGFEWFNEGMRDAVAGVWVKNKPHIDAVEGIRHVAFLAVSVLAAVGAILGWVAIAVSRVRVQRHERDGPLSRLPSGKQHLCSWCCAFVHGILALTMGGLMMSLAVASGEACVWARNDLLTYEGLQKFSPALFDAPAPLQPDINARRTAVSIAQSCFSTNRTGDMLEAVGLGGDSLIFQTELSEAFYNMDDRVSEPAAGMRSIDLLERLRSIAEDFGDMFVLDPQSEADPASGSLGLLSLSVNVENLLMGSGLQPDDTKAPNAVTTVRGLNNYAELIAGPGQYTFLHGTAGGGYVITSDRPGDAEINSLPLSVRNALLYARNKERFLDSNSSLRCDVLLPSGQVQIRRCGVLEFREHVRSEMQLIADALADTVVEAEAVKVLFTGNLKSQLLPTLSSVKTIRSLLFCQAMWRRVEELDESFCEDISPTLARGSLQALAQAAAAVIGLIVQYKAWRRLKDNKVLTEEIERFEVKLKTHKIQLESIQGGNGLQIKLQEGSSHADASRIDLDLKDDGEEIAVHTDGLQ
eukprot:TRINITY_DN90970_c0_g1_i1.p1 TRINITY_DN90970_c0_g1~~TRINITY_DN90970_c0_g1_i1.p1  ORF type:complete len:906 (-),score=177.38 TRINITY_DN90970_c0_g1_i1:56-2773(-)